MKFCLTFIILLSIIQMVYSHGHEEHQYIVREAWKLVEFQVPELASSDMANWIGTNQTDYCLCVVGGAYNEDKQDIVFMNCGWNFLTGCVETTLNHFWDADAGDNSTFSWNGNHTNALQKAKYMYYGTHSWYFCHQGNPDKYIWKLNHYGIDDLYLNGNYTRIGYYNVNGQWESENPHVNANFVDAFKKRTSYSILGRICHLLADMSVPAHVHNDAHSPVSQQGTDEYEEWCKGEIQQSYSMIDAFYQGGILFDVFDMNYPIRYLFYVMNQYADHFPSDGDGIIIPNLFEGDNNYTSTFSSNGLTDTYPVLDEVFAQLGTPPSSIDCNNQANHLIPFVIRATATLLLKFAEISGQYNPDINITVKNDFEFGQINVDYLTVASPFSNQFHFGTWHTFEAIDQVYGETGQSNYFRVFDSWSLPNGGTNSNQIITENVQFDGTYQANTRRQFNYDANISFLNGGEGGELIINGQTINTWPFSSYVLENNSISVEAPEHLKTVNGKQITYNLSNWEDGTNRNPRTIFPDDHFNITANFKGHMVSNTSNSTDGNNGRKLAQTTNNDWGMVYRDDDNIYYSFKSETGSDWTPEEKISRNGANRFPSICATDWNCAAMTWNWYSNGVYRPALRYQTGGDGHYGWIPALSSNPISPEGYFTKQISRPVCAPVTMINGEFIYVIFSGYNSENDSALYLFKHLQSDENGSRDLVVKIPGTGANSKNPSVCSNGEDCIYICWEDDGHIFYESYYTISDNFGYSAPRQVSVNANDGSVSGGPSVTYQGGDVVDICWHHFNGETSWKIHHRPMLKSGTDESEPVIYTASVWGENLSLPTIGYSETSENLYMTAQLGDMTLVFQFNGSGWDITENEFNGEYASINAKGGELQVVYTNNGDGLPYLIENAQVVEEGENRSAFIENEYRSALVDISALGISELSGTALISFGEIYSDGSNGLQKWPFLASMDRISFDNFHNTQPLYISEDLTELTLKYEIKINDLVKPSTLSALPFVKLDLFRQTNHSILNNIIRINLDSLKAGDTIYKDSLQIDLTGFHGETVYLSMLNIFQTLSNSTSHPKLFAEKIFRLNSDGTKENVLTVVNTTEIIPELFQLYQNYPNPFNPSTNIKFDLPESSPVKLVIYNLSGQVVKTLVNIQKPAGEHKAVWQGKDDNGVQVASGIYIMQLTAGKHQFSKKLMLLK